MDTGITNVVKVPFIHPLRKIWLVWPELILTGRMLLWAVPKADVRRTSPSPPVTSDSTTEARMPAMDLLPMKQAGLAGVQDF